MGCSTCSSKHGAGGCEANKAPQRDVIAETLTRIYPTLTWGEPDDEARFGAGLRPAEVARLARSVSVVAKAPTFVRPGGDDDLCSFIYVLCVGREPCLLDVRDERVPHSSLGKGEERVRERYLRVACSTVARIATVQEVSLELDRLPGGEAEIRELPRPGVYDKILLKRMRAVVDLLTASDLTHLDFGLVDKPVVQGRPGDYVARYADTPRVVNFLFYAAPPTTASVTLLGT